MLTTIKPVIEYRMLNYLPWGEVSMYFILDLTNETTVIIICGTVPKNGLFKW